MRRRAILGGLTLAVGLLVPSPARAQDLVITNARVIVGNGTTLPAGSVVVRAGRIQSAWRPRTPAGPLAGKLADIVIVDGDPLDLIHNVLNVKVTIKGGGVVHDARKR